jgi:hypothetical protein
MRNTSAAEIRTLFEQRNFRPGEGLLLRSLWAQLGNPRTDSLEAAVSEAVASGLFRLDGDWLKLV